MTILAAMKKNDDVWLMADRAISWDNFRRTDAKLSKIIPLDNALIATSGMFIYNEAMQFMLSAHPELRRAPFRNKNDVIAYFLKFHRFLRETFGQGSAEMNEIAKISGGWFLVVTENGIFEVYPNKSVYEYENFAALGSGSHMATAAMHVLYDREEHAETILTEVFQTVCSYVADCAGEMELVSARQLLRGESASKAVADKKFATKKPQTKTPVPKPAQKKVRK